MWFNRRDFGRFRMRLCETIFASELIQRAWGCVLETLFAIEQSGARAEPFGQNGGS